MSDKYYQVRRIVRASWQRISVLPAFQDQEGRFKVNSVDVGENSFSIKEKSLAVEAKVFEVEADRFSVKEKKSNVEANRSDI